MSATALYEATRDRAIAQFIELFPDNPLSAEFREFIAMTTIAPVPVTPPTPAPAVDSAVDSNEALARERATFTSAKDWRNYVLENYLDLDADEQYWLKLAENRDARPSTCGRHEWVMTPTGWHSRKLNCGICPDCKKRRVATYRRALNERQGIANPQHIAAHSLEDFEQDAIPENTGENAPPLARVEGPLSYIVVEGNTARLRLARQYRDKGIAYSAKPYFKDGDVVYGFIVNNDEGDPVGVAVTDAVIEAWLTVPPGTRASGKLLPAIDELERRYRQALPYEVVCPELDKHGKPIDPDIFALEIPGIVTEEPLPNFSVNLAVNDAESLQAAITVIHRKAVDYLFKKNVIYAVYKTKLVYTRYSTLPEQLAKFNRVYSRQSTPPPKLE